MAAQVNLRRAVDTVVKGRIGPGLHPDVAATIERQTREEYALATVLVTAAPARHPPDPVIVRAEARARVVRRPAV